ncbi:peptidase M14 [Cristinia sonorae]|uniref:Inactive metallocarboxypeptidase ECM14 n=1 Tax=Cristinia sonorae TaxID=1940300 RepID=A0A8K0UEP0_9AGAR|nr:peptidase M14 [Cristinia sonorae]
MLASALVALGITLPLVHADQTILSNVHPSSASVLRRFQTSNEHEREILVTAAQLANADIWQVASDHVDVYLPPSHEPFSSTFSNLGLHYNDSFIPQSLLEVPPKGADPFQSWSLISLSNSTFHEDYHPLSDIDEFVDELLRLHPDLISRTNIGHTSEGREMHALTISRPKANLVKGSEYAKKTGFVVTGAQHAREWIATSTAMFIAHALVSDPSEPYSLSTLLNHFDFHIVIVPNPDGYIYTWEKDRLWYKNRQVIGPSERCLGIDMNRNWGYKWKPEARFPALKKKKKPTSPVDPCAPWYPGHRPFESPEVNNIANWITTLPNLRAFVDLRSYGQMLSSPYSYSCKRAPKDAEDQIEAAMGAARSTKAVHGTVFTTGRLCEMLYKAPGNIVDYMFATAGIKYSYAAHLRDTGTYGFSLPPEWIRPVGEETVSMIKSLTEFIGAH